ncbi:dihydropteroate synthase [Anaerosacchariphilus polymeriproducens]|uniref:Dihydropteroate synthase n=1 Tax=Anaerosacchariphilus polymeriproducens TaxID=1812858 RepID=A0A371AWD6_9FIRM|nr:dihydropteroate synthase [Anaerosacchariphilus polymeriproducens]RDU23888.1 dihydropteroate synthase [Anaerosacchariphilus polymeriproducens]
MLIGGREFDLKNHTYVMGILNVTPDSFSDGNKYNEKDAALKQVEKMVLEGVDIVDLGGESTRPGYTLISEEEEIGRVIPIIEAIKKEFEIPLSLDTYKSNVAKAGIDAGVDMINDVWGLKYDDLIAEVISDSQLPCCLMHNRKEPIYDDFLNDMMADIAQTIKIAEEAGISNEKIILDPGIGFGKKYEHNLYILKNMEALHMFGYPLLLGASRKSVIGKCLDLLVSDRVEGTLVTTVMAVMKNYGFVRVHDIKENVRAVKMAEAIMKQ